MLLQDLKLGTKQCSEPRRFLLGSFASAWEQRKLGKLEDDGSIKLGRGEVINRADLTDNPGNYPVFSSSASGDGEFGRYGKYMFDIPQITWSIDGGGRFFLRNDLRYSVTNVGGWLRVEAPHQVYLAYLFYELSQLWARKSFDYTMKAHPSVIRDEYTLMLPEISEQMAIGKLFINLDKLITLHQRAPCY